MKTLLAFALLLLPAAAWGQAKINVVGDQQLRPAVQKIAESLNVPLPTWSIVLLTDSQWGDASAKLHTHAGFTILVSRHTFLREAYVRSHSWEQVRRALAHEAGHLITNSMREDDAERVARTLVGMH